VGVGHVDLIANMRIIIVAKVLVQSKNLFRLKGSLGPCLGVANITQHVPLLGSLLRAVSHLYSGSEPIKGGAGEGLSIRRLQNKVEATSPVKDKKEEADHSIHCEQ
jgi:hypothetical protein